MSDPDGMWNMTVPGPVGVVKVRLSPEDIAQLRKIAVGGHKLTEMRLVLLRSGLVECDENGAWEITEEGTRVLAQIDQAPEMSDADRMQLVKAKLNPAQLSLLRRLAAGETVGMPSAYFDALARLNLAEQRGAWVATVYGKKLIEQIDQAPPGNWSAETEVPMSPAMEKISLDSAVEEGFVIKDGHIVKDEDIVGKVRIDRDKGVMEEILAGEHEGLREGCLIALRGIAEKRDGWEEPRFFGVDVVGTLARAGLIERELDKGGRILGPFVLTKMGQMMLDENPEPDIGESKIILSWDEAGMLQSISQGKYVRKRAWKEVADVNREVRLLTSLNRLGLIEPDETGIDWQMTPAGKVFLATNPIASKRVRGTDGWFKMTFTDPDGEVSEYEGPLGAGSTVQTHNPGGDSSTLLETDPEYGKVKVLALRIWGADREVRFDDDR